MYLTHAIGQLWLQVQVFHNMTICHYIQQTDARNIDNIYNVKPFLLTQTSVKISYYIDMK